MPQRIEEFAESGVLCVHPTSALPTTIINICAGLVGSCVHACNVSLRLSCKFVLQLKAMRWEASAGTYGLFKQMPVCARGSER